MYPKNHNTIMNSSLKIPFKLKDDNPRQFGFYKYRSVNVKNANFDWTRTLGDLILYGLFGSLGHARLTAIKSASGHDIILVYTPLSK